jgi:hypothetical protein
MKKTATRVVFQFITAFVLSTAGFVLGSFAMPGDALAVPNCPGRGAKCVNGNCDVVCTANTLANATCADTGATCLMGYQCLNVDPCPG